MARCCVGPAYSIWPQELCRQFTQWQFLRVLVSTLQVLKCSGPQMRKLVLLRVAHSLKNAHKASEKRVQCWCSSQVPMVAHSKLRAKEQAHLTCALRVVLRMLGWSQKKELMLYLNSRTKCSAFQRLVMLNLVRRSRPRWPVQEQPITLFLQRHMC